jgi:hypothetical protein
MVTDDGIDIENKGRNETPRQPFQLSSDPFSGNGNIFHIITSF